MKHFILILVTIFVVYFIGMVSLAYAVTLSSIPLPPRNINIQQQDNFAFLKWKKPLTKKFSGFRIYRSQKSGWIGNLIKEVNKNTFSFLDTDIRKDITYFYTVHTIRKNGKESKNKKQFSIKILSDKVTIQNMDLRLPNLPEGFADNEVEIEPIILGTEDNKIRVIVPKGYEELGKKHLEDLKYCYNLVPQFVGVTPYYDGIILKIYITEDNINQGSGGQGVIWYQRSQENIDADLSDVQTNSPEGFLYKSSPEYCANTHEFVHNVLAFRPIPGEFNEGIAEYTQKHTQPGSKDGFECRENGWYGVDMWGDGSSKLFDYNFFRNTEGESQFGAGAKLYRSALCLWEKFDEKFGVEKRKQVFGRLNEYIWESGTIKRGDQIIFENIDYRGINGIFMEEILFNIVSKFELKPFLEKFGYKISL